MQQAIEVNGKRFQRADKARLDIARVDDERIAAGLWVDEGDPDGELVWQTFHQSELPNDLVSAEDLERFGISTSGYVYVDVGGYRMKKLEKRFCDVFISDDAKRIVIGAFADERSMQYLQIDLDKLPNDLAGALELECFGITLPGR